MHQMDIAESLHCGLIKCNYINSELPLIVKLYALRKSLKIKTKYHGW
jgi:hypothetical protein